MCEVLYNFSFYGEVTFCDPLQDLKDLTPEEEAALEKAQEILSQISNNDENILNDADTLTKLSKDDRDELFNQVLYHWLQSRDQHVQKCNPCMIRGRNDWNNIRVRIRVRVCCCACCRRIMRCPRIVKEPV